MADRDSELEERVQMLTDIALSALALKLTIEHGFTPSLHALDRDIDAYAARFGPLAGHALKTAKVQ